MNKVLVIQTAFIGDAILATALLESLHANDPDTQLDIVIRKGNEKLFDGHPYINKVFVWNKKEGKYKSLLRLIREIRRVKYSKLINLQRFASAGFMAFRAKADQKIGFKKTPFAFIYNYKGLHAIGNGEHEVERNLALANLAFKDEALIYKKPKLYTENVDLPEDINTQSEYLVMAPSSVWATKQLPVSKWIELIALHHSSEIYLIGAPSDTIYLQNILKQISSAVNIKIRTDLTLLQSAKLIQFAKRTYVNDSAPLHLASSVNAKVTAFFCSTIPAFGFGPLSDDFTVVESPKKLACRPCGLHGHKNCPKGHFECGTSILVSKS